MNKQKSHGRKQDIMHILIIAQYFPPDMGGASTRAFNIVKGLLKKVVKSLLLLLFHIIHMEKYL